MKYFALALLASAAIAQNRSGSYGSTKGSSFNTFNKDYCCTKGQIGTSNKKSGDVYSGGYDQQYDDHDVQSYGGYGYGGRSFDGGFGELSSRQGYSSVVGHGFGGRSSGVHGFGSHGYTPRGYNGIGQGDRVSRGVIDDGRRGYFGGASGAVVGSGFRGHGADGRGYDTLNDYGQVGGINAHREFSVEQRDVGDLKDLGGQRGLSGLGGYQANIAQRPGLSGLKGRRGVHNGLRGLGDVSANQNLGGLSGLGARQSKRGLNYGHGVRGLNGIGGGDHQIRARAASFGGSRHGLRKQGVVLDARGDYLESRGGHEVRSGLAHSRSDRSVHSFGVGKRIPGGQRQGSVHGGYGRSYGGYGGYGW